MQARDKSPARVLARLVTTITVTDDEIAGLPPEYKELADHVINFPLDDRIEELFLFCRDGGGGRHNSRWPLQEEIARIVNGPPEPPPPRRPAPIVFPNERGKCVGEAVRWLEMGYRPIPLRPADDPQPKAPYGENWQERTWTSEELRRFYAQHPTAGVGLLLGDIVDVEVDDWSLALEPLRRIWPGLDIETWSNGLPTGLPQTLSFTSSLCAKSGLPKIHMLFNTDHRVIAIGKSVIRGLVDKDGTRRGNKYYLGMEIRIGKTGPDTKHQQTVIPPTNIGYQRKWNESAEGKPLRLKPFPGELLVDLWFYHDPVAADREADELRLWAEDPTNYKRPRLEKPSKLKSTTWKGEARRASETKHSMTVGDIKRAAWYADLAAIVEHYTGFDVSGGGHILCPAHDDHRPSMGIYEGDDRIWRFKCWACGVWGSAVDFIAGMEGLTKKEAAEVILKQGLSQVRQAREKKAPIWQDMEWQATVDDIIRMSAANLRSAPYALQWLKGRGLADATVDMTMLGWCMGSRKADGFKFPRGIVIPLLLPGHSFDEQLGSKPLWSGFIVRSLAKNAGKPSGPAKYLSVGSRGFGYPFPDARPGVPALVLEGELDALLAWQHLSHVCHPITFGGVNNKPRQLAGIECCDPWFVCLDNDQAGTKAATDWIACYSRARLAPLPSMVGGLPVKDFTEFVLAGGQPVQLLAARRT